MEVSGSAVESDLWIEDKILYTRLSTGSTQEDRNTSPVMSDKLLTGT